MNFRTKKATGTLLWKGALFIFVGNITLANPKSGVKHAAACKPLNQQINGQERKGKKGNNSGIAFE